MIRTNSELQHKLQLRCDDVILLSTKLVLSRLSPRHTHFNNMNYYANRTHIESGKDPNHKVKKMTHNIDHLTLGMPCVVPTRPDVSTSHLTLIDKPLSGQPVRSFEHVSSLDCQIAKED
jgi:hypothetical protein